MRDINREVELFKEQLDNPTLTNVYENSRDNMYQFIITCDRQDFELDEDVFTALSKPIL